MDLLGAQLGFEPWNTQKGAYVEIDTLVFSRINASILRMSRLVSYATANETWTPISETPFKWIYTVIIVLFYFINYDNLTGIIAPIITAFNKLLRAT